MPLGGRKMPGQLGAGRVVEPDAGGAEVLGEVGAGAGPGDEQDVRGEVQQPGERDLHRRRAQPRGQRGQHGIGEQPAPHPAGQAQRAERHERDVPRRALGEDVRGALVGQVEEVLHADDLRLGDARSRCRRETLLSPMPSISPSSRACGQRRELDVEPLARGLGRVRHAQVHGRQPPGAERGEVVLDALAQLVRFVEPQQRAAGVAAGGHLADDRQVVRIGVQRLADELVHRAGPVVLRGVDVVHPGRDGRTEYPQRLVAIPRRPEDPVAGELHRAVPGPVHAPRAEREGPAERARSGSRHALRRRRRARPHR